MCETVSLKRNGKENDTHTHTHNKRKEIKEMSNKILIWQIKWNGRITNIEDWIPTASCSPTNVGKPFNVYDLKIIKKLKNKLENHKSNI